VNYAQALLLGAIQGITEFLPVSSSGHLVLARTLLGVTLPGITFEIMVHLGTLLAVIIFFRGDIWRIIAALFGEVFGGSSRRRKGVWKNSESRLALLVFVGTIPATIVALLLRQRIEKAFGSPVLVSVAFLVTGLVLWRSEGAKKGRRREADLKLGDAVVIGIVQAAAIAPGLSRSGLTIAYGLKRRFDRSLAARFSFLLSIPAVGGAVVLDLSHVLKAKTTLPWPVIGAGALAAAITGLFSISITLRAVKTGSFRYFALYCWAVGASALVFLVMRARGF
jgi:undecaprenyl-diphosphatase